MPILHNRTIRCLVSNNATRLVKAASKFTRLLWTTGPYLFWAPWNFYECSSKINSWLFAPRKVQTNTCFRQKACAAKLAPFFTEHCDEIVFLCGALWRNTVFVWSIVMKYLSWSCAVHCSTAVRSSVTVPSWCNLHLGCACRLANLFTSLPASLDPSDVESVTVKWGLDSHSYSYSDAANFTGKRPLVSFLSWFDYCDQLVMEAFQVGHLAQFVPVVLLACVHNKVVVVTVFWYRDPL